MAHTITLFTQKIEKVAAANKFFYKILAYYYKNMIKKEIELAKISSLDNVLFIGGGPCPFSGILLHEYTGAAVTIIDNDNFCVECSRSVIESLGYDKKIKILQGDGQEILPENFTVIHMAAQINPLNKVFYQLEKKCSHGVRILVRFPKNKFSCSASEDDFLKIWGNRTFHSKLKNVESTALYIKNGGENEKSRNCSCCSNFNSADVAV